MIALLLIAATLLVCVLVRLVLTGCRSICELIDGLNRDQRNGYALPRGVALKSRKCPQWIRRANWRTVQ